MSDHADTIRDVLCQPINGEYSRELAARSLDALLAENQRKDLEIQRLRDLLTESERWMGKDVIPRPTSPFRQAVRTALAAVREENE